MRNVYISLKASGCIKVDNDVATKMLEVYDKSKKFQPIKVNATTTVIVDNNAKVGYPICVELFQSNYICYVFSLNESQKLRESLEKAENFVKEIINND